MVRKVFFAILLATLLGGCQKPPNFEQEHPGAKGQPPVILGYYSPEAIRPGETLKIYLRGQDVDGDMKYIVAVLHQTGDANYPTSEIWLKGEDQAQFGGYVFMNTPPLEMTSLSSIGNLNVSIFIRDWAGNKSETVKLPLTFDESATPEKIPANWQEAAKHELGYINSSILSVDQLGPSGRGWN